MQPFLLVKTTLSVILHVFEIRRKPDRSNFEFVNFACTPERQDLFSEDLWMSKLSHTMKCYVHQPNCRNAHKHSHSELHIFLFLSLPVPLCPLFMSLPSIPLLLLSVPYQYRKIEIFTSEEDIWTYPKTWNGAATTGIGGLGLLLPLPSLPSLPLSSLSEMSESEPKLQFGLFVSG